MVTHRHVEGQNTVDVARETEMLISDTSTQSFEDAIQQGVSRAASTLPGVHHIQLKDESVLFERGAITGYQVNFVVFGAKSEVSGEGLGVVLKPTEYRWLLEAEEELEDIQAYDEALEELERGEDELAPWKQAKREIERERAEVRSRGEL